MNLVELSLRRNVFAWILMFALITFGAISLNRMGVSQLPDVDFPVLSVSVSYEGAAPEVIESEIIDPIEQRLLVIEGVKEMRAMARQGSGVITLELSLDRNVDVALQEVQSALSQLRLPLGVDPPIIRKSNPEEDPILILAVFGEKSLLEILKWVDLYLLDQLRFIKGIGEVGIGGFSDRNLRIWIDPIKLKNYQLTVRDVVFAIQTQHLETAAGQLLDGNRELSVRLLGQAEQISEIENIPILQRSGQLIQDRIYKIKDVASVESGLSDIRRLAWTEGQTAIAITVRKQRGTNEVEVAERVKQKLTEIAGKFPEGLNYKVNVDFTRATKATVGLAKEKLIVASLVTIFVCFLFLGNITSAINILFSIPTSILGTFIILYFSGFTLNIFTLLALTLAVSIVVDDAIMLLENIVRHHHMGKSPYKASLDGALEVLPAASAATMAVVAVFLPVVFMSGVIGKFFFQFGVTMSAAVLLSLLEAITITPMRTSAFLRETHKIPRFEKWLDIKFEKLAELYQKSLSVPIRWPKLVLISSLILFAASLYSIKKVRQEFVPAQDQDVIILTAQAAPGSSLDFTANQAKRIEAVLKTEKSIATYFVSVGAGGPGAQVNQIFIPITLKPKSERALGHLAIMQKLRESFKSIKELRISMRDTSARNLTTGRVNPVAFNLRGPDLKILDKSSQEIINTLEQEGLALDLDTDFRLGNPELDIVPDRTAVAARGLTMEAVSQTLSIAFAGIRQGRYTSDGRRIDIRIKVADTRKQALDSISSLYIQNLYGNLIRLSDVVSVKETKSLQSISRINRQRSISIFGNLAPGQSQANVLKKAEQVANKILPEGFSFALEGAATGFAEAFSGLNTALAIGVLVAYMILAVQFNSFIHPIVVLIALPFSVSGALLSLWAFNVSLNLFSFIGLIVLMGIAKKNSILLVEFTNQLRHRENLTIKDSLIKACPIRLRPILMTSVATVAAALPLVIDSGIGVETRIPMGLTIIGGTIVSTVMTLFVVPSLYLLLESLPWSSKKRMLN